MSNITKLQSLAINPEGFAFDPGSGDSFMLNETGILITKSLQESVVDDEIVARLAREYDIDVDSARRDVDDFLNRLKAFKLI